MPQVLPDGENKIIGDIKLFSKAESYFTDTTLFDEGAALKETMSVAISSTRKKGLRVLKILIQCQLRATSDKVK